LTVFIFNHISQTKLIEHGVYIQALNAEVQKSNCLSELESPLGIQDVYTVFLFIGTAILASFLCFCIEHIIKFVTEFFSEKSMIIVTVRQSTHNSNIAILL
jgi:hypothetical protein